MIRILLKHEYEFHSEWEELTQEEALIVFSIIRRLEERKISINHARAELFMRMSGINIPREKREGAFWANVYQVASAFRFFYKYVYTDEGFKHLSADTRSKLEKYLPFELEQTPEIRVAANMPVSYTFDMVFGRNLVTTIKHKNRVINTYSFSNADGIITTSLTALQYVDAIAIVKKYCETQSPTVLDLLVSILCHAMPYTSLGASDEQKLYTDINQDLKLAILYNFMAICQWIRTRTHFNILWLSTKKSKPSDSVGDMIYSISKEGYGTPDQVSNMNLVVMLELMKKITIGNIQSLHAKKVKLVEIADITGYPVEIITKLI